MKKWILLVPAIASLAVGTFILVKKDKEEENNDPAKNDAKKNAAANPREGNYSFVSGFSDAKTVDVKFTYDADRFSFKQIEEEFLTFTSVSHAAAIYGEDFNIQIEYSDLAGGENFAALAENKMEILYGELRRICSTLNIDMFKMLEDEEKQYKPKEQ